MNDCYTYRCAACHESDKPAEAFDTKPQMKISATHFLWQSLTLFNWLCAIEIANRANNSHNTPKTLREHLPLEMKQMTSVSCCVSL